MTAAFERLVFPQFLDRTALRKPVRLLLIYLFHVIYDSSLGITESRRMAGWFLSTAQL